MDFALAASDAVRRTRYLLFERGSRSRWLSFGVLQMLGGSAGGVSFPSKLPSRRSTLLGLAALPLAGEQGVWLLGVGAVCGLLMAIALSWLAAVARVVLIENIVHDRDSLVEPMGRLGPLGTSLFGWTAATTVGAGALAAGVLKAAAPALPAFSSQPSLPELLAWGDWVLALTALLMPILAITVLLTLVSNELVVPVMYHDNVGVLRGWFRLAQLGLRRPLAWAGWLAVRLVLAAATGIVEMVLVVMTLLAAGTVLGVPAIAAVLALDGDPTALLGIALAGSLAAVLLLVPALVLIATPFTVFLRSFSLYCLQQADPRYRLLPEGGRGALE